MTAKTKKILIIIGFIILVLILAFFLYLVFFKKPTTVLLVEPSKKISTEILPRLPVDREEWEKMTVSERVQQDLPPDEWPEVEQLSSDEMLSSHAKMIVAQIDEIANGKETWVSPVVMDSVMGATLSSSGDASIYYNPETGYFYEVDHWGNKTLMSDQVFYDVKNISWAPSKDRAVIEYPDGFKVIYNFDKKKQYIIPNNWEDFYWSPVSDRIAFKATSKYPENNWLAIASADGSQAKPIEHMGDNADKVTMSWSPHNQIIAFSATGDPRNVWEQELILIGQNGENFSSLVVDGRDFQPKWSPYGDKIAYSIYAAEFDYQPRLYIVDGEIGRVGTNKKILNLATWADKCAFNNDGSFLYCAVPKELPEGAGLVRELAEDARDDFYKINTDTGRISFLAEPAMGGYNVEYIYISEKEDYLYFTDADSHHLRCLQLK